ncbi:MAG: hypothetical protein JNL60_07055 [Bacteroidia bacterium]|nr:hypothetical protein [Bacteroidia bacterium]
MKNKNLNYRLELLGIISGGVTGYLYWLLVGCSTGTCAITSSPIYSTLYGAVLGWFIFGVFHKPKENTQTDK